MTCDMERPHKGRKITLNILITLPIMFSITYLVFCVYYLTVLQMCQCFAN